MNYISFAGLTETEALHSNLIFIPLPVMLYMSFYTAFYVVLRADKQYTADTIFFFLSLVFVILGKKTKQNNQDKYQIFSHLWCDETTNKMHVKNK